MKLLRTGAVRALVLVVAMLAAIGAWEIARGTVLRAQGGTQEQEFPHFVCYKVHHKEHSDAGRGFEAVVQLDNQFEIGSVVKVKDHEKLLCVPTVKKLLYWTEKDHDDDHDSQGSRRGR